MRTATITIGKNINSTPMHDKVWEHFQNDIRMLFMELFVDAEYQGEWNNIKETSRLFIGQLYAINEETLETYLAKIANKYGQDAIGLVLNSRPTSLVSKAA